eukprot:7378850-Prymnesium_polylepis.2
MWIATRRTSFAELVPAGRALFVGGMYPYSRHHQLHWWLAADTILQAGGCIKKGADQRVIGVTPALLATQISRAVVERIGQLHGRGANTAAAWEEALFRFLHGSVGRRGWVPGLDWSEYTLY